MSTKLWYLSFASPKAFLGACVVEGDGVVEAVKEAARLGINPGGEVLGFEVPVGRMDVVPRGVLLSREELMELGIAGKSIKEMNSRERDIVLRNGHPLCEEHNK